MSSLQKISIRGLGIWLLCAIFFTYEFMLRTLLGTFEHPLLQDLKLSLLSFSVLSSTAYLAIYGAAQLPVGILLDKFGLKKTLTIAISLCAAAVMGFAWSHQFSSAFIFRVLMGLGSSVGFLALLVVVYDWLPIKKSGLFIGLSQFIGTLGPMLAAGPMNAIAETGGIDWRMVFLGLGCFGAILATLVFIFVDNNREYASGFQILKLEQPLSSTLINLIKQPQLWYLGLYSASVYFTIEYLSENSGKAFLILHGYSSQTASNFITLAWLGYAIGCPLLGLISDFFARRKQVLILASILNIFAGFIIVFMASQPILLAVAFFTLGLGASGQSVAFATVAEQCKAHYLAAGLGFNNACIIMLASANAPLIAWVLNHLQSLHSKLSISDYQQAFTVLLIFMAFGFITSCFFIKETFCKSTKSATKLTY